MTATRSRRPAIAPLSLCGILAVSPAAAQELSPAGDPVSTGLGVGMAVVVLLAVLIGLSVVAKLLIVFGVVPRRPERGVHALVHGMANFVGGLTRARPRRPGRISLDDE